MGYRRKRKIYKLVFEGEYEGLEVQMGALTTGEFLDIVAIGKVDKEDSKEIEALLHALADHLISWTLEDDTDGPVPADFEGVKSNELPLNLMIIDAWTDAVGGVPDPLPTGSPSGGPFPAVSIPMEPLSASPQNWSAPSGSSGPAVPSTFSPVPS